MDSQLEGSSGRFAGQWAFLSNSIESPHPRSLPPCSTHVRSEHDNNVQLPTSLALQYSHTSRSARRENPGASVGAIPSCSGPSQPVLLRIHSAEASAHLDPAPRTRKKKEPSRERGTTLPAVAEFSIKSLLSAIEEDIEDDINGISEILGRSRFVLANRHESHLPPQGEIRAINRSPYALEEAAASRERVVGDEILILQDDASLSRGSHTGSNAYRLLESLRAMPRTRRMRRELVQGHRATRQPVRSESSPAVLVTDQIHSNETEITEPVIAHRRHISREYAPGLSNFGSTAPTAATYLLANAESRTDTTAVTNRELGFNAIGQEGRTQTSDSSFNDQHRPLGQLLSLNEFRSMTNWVLRTNPDEAQPQTNAETQLRAILGRNNDRDQFEG